MHESIQEDPRSFDAVSIASITGIQRARASRPGEACRLQKAQVERTTMLLAHSGGALDADAPSAGGP
ncbi:Hypothetical protein A7982_03043 [Minicystis rosea]|nr:Hypothetical protein A7982_03043 [Minicystis rosea]